MSYAFTITYKEIGREELEGYLLELMGFNKKHADEILSKNASYIPSIRHNWTNPNISNYPASGWRRADREWAQNLFTTRFLYWPEESLLGIVGSVQNGFDPGLREVRFTDSTDQNYPFESWSGISLFERIVEECKNADVQAIRNACPGLFFPDWEIRDEIDYFRKTMVYERIYSELDLRSYENEVPGKFNIFSMNAFNYSAELFEMYEKLEVVRQQILKKR